MAKEAIRRGRADQAQYDDWLDPRADPLSTVENIKHALGDSIYGSVLRSIFRPKPAADGRLFTPIHAALTLLPLRALATTNYDPGLVEARHVLRPELPSARIATWKDDDAVQRWLTSDIFKEETLPLLFAHGIWDRTDTLVLALSEYQRAYMPGTLFRRLFDKLWAQERLVFVGVGFSDAWLNFLAGEVITQSRATSEPRHIAIVGLDEKRTYTPDMRRTFEARYGAEVYFYRVAHDPNGIPDHSELGQLLDSLHKKKWCQSPKTT